MVRSFLDGRFENTAFCLLSPDGTERLSRTGRSPAMAFARGRGTPPGELGQATVEAMQNVARRYRPTGDPGSAVVQDFHSFRQALNVAAADQRLLLFVSPVESDQGRLATKLAPVMADGDIVGKFHTDFFSSKTDTGWTDAVTGAKPGSAISIIQADKFGQSGKILTQLPGDASPSDIKTALLAANSKFAETEQRKTYSDHVREGRRNHVYFEREIEYGEDRDGDGIIDHRGGLGRGPGGRR